MHHSNRTPRHCHTSFYGCLLLSLMLLMPAGCKKATPEAQESQPAPVESPKADAPAANPAQDAAAPEAKTAPDAAPEAKTEPDAAQAEVDVPTPEAPETATAKSCEKWGTHPLFSDGRAFDYEIKIERAACCDLDKDDPDWECDEDGMCELNKTITVHCKNALIQTESYFCTTELTCKEAGKDYIDFPAGHWLIDANGLYYVNAELKLAMNKQAQPGNCKKTEKIQCKPETLAYEYQNFAEETPDIPFVKADIHHDECDPDGDFCDEYHLTHKGTVWSRESAASGGDSSSDSVTYDETRGITAFKNDFSGGSERHIDGRLK